MSDRSTVGPVRSAALDDALRNAGHALLTRDPVRALAQVLTRFRDEHRVEVFREAADECDEAGGVYTGRSLNEHAAGAFSLMETFQRKANEAEFVATLCDPWVPCENGGEPCSTHERLIGHFEDDHELCEPDCAKPAAPRPPAHLGRQANAEGCPGCVAERVNLPYPFLCPAEPGTPAKTS